MKYRWGIASVLLLATLATSGQSGSPAGIAPVPGPLSPFERLIGGQWHLEGSYQEFEWGVGRASVRARGYFVVDGEPRLVSEGMWYWHPKENAIKGIFTAIEMPFHLLVYTTRFEGNNMVSRLDAYDADGVVTEYTETWEFLDDTHFAWTLSRKEHEGLRQEMSGVYARQ